METYERILIALVCVVLVSVMAWYVYTYEPPGFLFARIAEVIALMLWWLVLAALIGLAMRPSDSANGD